MLTVIVELFENYQKLTKKQRFINSWKILEFSVTFKTNKLLIFKQTGIKLVFLMYCYVKMTA